MSNDVIKSHQFHDSNPNLHEISEQLRIQQEQFLKQQRDHLKDFNNQSASSLSFTQGLILGQLSVILVIGIFIKFFVFQDVSNIGPNNTTKDGAAVIVRRDKKNQTSNKDVEDLDDEDIQARSIASILEKTYYDVDNHPSESLDWFNVLIAQTISQIRTEALISDNIFHSLNDFLSKLAFPDYLDTIRITEIDIGDDFPILSNCRIKQSADGSGRLEAKIDVDLSDTITLGIETRLLINYPRPKIAALPIQLSVSLVRFSGCLAVSLFSPNEEDLPNLEPPSQNGDLSPHVEAPKIASSPSHNSSMKKVDKKSEKQSGTAIRFSFSPDYRLEFTTKSLIGSRAKLQDVPKISVLIESKLKQWFVERCVEPRFQIIKIPSLWPRTKNTREDPSEKVDQ